MQERIDMKAKHSKYKNTGIIFELLVRQITSDTLNGVKTSPAIKIIREFFKKNTSLMRLYSIAVLPEFQGNAVGKALFEHAEDQVKLNAKKGLTLEVRLDNQRHIQRYLKLGYQPYSEVDEYYPDGMACLKLKKLFS